ncbi:hypothetical protein [Streptomyces pseudogriseolus]|uniref:hypothetical protein n=1 Tax=Streptomyces pseudogriseolus TaxID=36817 RepID=UPI003FA283BE
MALGIADVLSRVASHAQATGLFDTVMTHEPKNAPTGSSVAVWVRSIEPIRMRSGLDKVSVLVRINIRLYANMLQEPQDDIDRDLVMALDALLTAYSGEFELGDQNRTIDVLGAAGFPMGAEAAYVQHDTTLFRVFVITLPILINDVWDEVA